MTTLTIGTRLRTREENAASFVVTNVTDKKISYRTLDFGGYKAKVNFIKVFTVTVKRASESLESGWWVVVS